MTCASPTLRQRVHAENLRTAREAARRLLAEGGVEAVTMSAVAKQVGIAGPGMYRYFDDRAHLIRTVYEQTLAEVVDFLDDADAAQVRDDFAARLHATTHALFVWCRKYRHEFELLMGHGFRIAVGESEGLRLHIAHRISPVFVRTFDEMWRAGKPYPADHDIPSDLAAELADYRTHMLSLTPDVAPEFPLGVVRNMMVCWRQIYGLLCMTAYDHLNFAFNQFDATFSDMIATLIDGLGMPLSDKVVLLTTE